MTEQLLSIIPWILVFFAGAYVLLLLGFLIRWLTLKERKTDLSVFFSGVQSATIVLAVITLGWEFHRQTREETRLLREEAEQVQRYTFDFIASARDQRAFESLRALIGLRQLRDLYAVTDYKFFAAARGDNVQILYAVRNWFYQEHFSTISTFLDQVVRCLKAEICHEETTLLLVCPYVEYMTIPEEKWLTWGPKREPYADPMFRLHMNPLVKELRNLCPIPKRPSPVFIPPSAPFHSSASYGEAKRFLTAFERSNNVNLPMNKAMQRDERRIRKLRDLTEVDK